MAGPPFVPEGPACSSGDSLSCTTAWPGVPNEPECSVLHYSLAPVSPMYWPLLWPVLRWEPVGCRLSLEPPMNPGS